MAKNVACRTDKKMYTKY